MKSAGRRAIAAQARTGHVDLPPRQEIAAPALAKLRKGEQLTPEEQRLIIFSSPRKTRRAHRVKTTDIREVLDAMRVMRVPGTPDEMRKARNKAKAMRRKVREAGGVAGW